MVKFLYSDILRLLYVALHCYMVHLYYTLLHYYINVFVHSLTRLEEGATLKARHWSNQNQVQVQAAQPKGFGVSGFGFRVRVSVVEAASVVDSSAQEAFGQPETSKFLGPQTQNPNKPKNLKPLSFPNFTPQPSTLNPRP